MLTENEFYIKFNVQNLLEMDRPQNDYRFVAGCFQIDIGEAERICKQFEAAVKKLAEEYVGEKGMPPFMENKEECPIAFIGDSITSEREGFFRVIEYMLRENPAYKLMDVSVSGAKIADINDRLYERVISKKPKLAHVMIGTNDARKQNVDWAKCNTSAEEFEKDMAYLLRSLKEAGIITVVSTLPAPQNDRLGIAFDGRNWIYDQSDIRDFNRIIAGVSQDYACLLNDWVDGVDEDILSYDGVHLNARGTKLLLDSVVGKLNQALSV